MEKTQSVPSDRITAKPTGANPPGANVNEPWDRPRVSETHKDSCTPAQGVGDTIKNVASDVSETASGVAQDVKAKVQGAAQMAASKAEETRLAAGEQMEALAGKIREGGEVVSEKAEQFGHYLREHDFSAIGRDVTQIVRRYPMQSLLIGIGLGILLGRSAR